MRCELRFVVLLAIGFAGIDQAEAGKESSWVYSQSTGELSRDGKVIAKGYSGKGDGRNNPEKETIADLGPIPRGDYSIGKPHDSKKTGPFVMDLIPMGHKAHGRTAFQIHGDNKAMDASSGCVIFPLEIRKKISAGSSKLTVVR